MVFTPLSALCIASLWSALGLAFGGPFANLDFEEATTNNVSFYPGTPYPNGQGQPEDLLPGWTLLQGTNLVSVVFFNGLAPDLGGESLVSTEALVDWRYQRVFPFGIDGKYAFAVTADYKPFVLSQIGDVPADARLITMNLTRSLGTGFEVRMNGVLIENGDISAFAGKTVELEFRMWLENLGGLGVSIALDSITFTGPLRLEYQRSGNQLLMSWSFYLSNYVLEEATDPGGLWTTAVAGIQRIGGQRVAAVAMDGSAKFYRLRLVHNSTP